ncbi:class I SAM-dependent methyltransferase [Amycolatopsis viridis]|uniref:Trans-aconitate methyltransferase n=1 Tax=Amycolatopsis viridis TaxID=185678 RepID=A0ABX0SLX0_9PSEU|nr:class I SAM-dependent methyltransferase [Amycolatopsis viridis]NIH77933.1 trans-aconitate methyltransferase [Amycolatopsis viridis]
MTRPPLVARQFSHPTGPLGRVAGRMMALGNGGLNAWVVATTAARLDPAAVGRVAELGPGPGLGLARLLDAFPHAQVWGVDRSEAMLRQARRRNAAAHRAGRLTLLRGDTTAILELAPVDLIVAVHVLYFLADPATQLGRLHAALAPGGVLALGYQLRPHMPAISQQQFPRGGHRLYESDDEVRDVLRDAGWSTVDISVDGPREAPHGRLALATR